MQSPASTQLTEAPLARRVLVFQAILTLVATLVVMPFGFSPALSVFLGGGVCLVANAAVVLWVFRDYRAQDPAALVGRFYSAEILKFALVLGFFAAAFLGIEGLNVPSMIGSYFLVQVLPPIFAAQKAPHPPRGSKAHDQVR
jgi:ATP synthase protein I